MCFSKLQSTYLPECRWMDVFESTLLCLVLGGGGQIANFLEKIPEVYVIFIRKWPKKHPPTNLRNLDNFPLDAFYSTLLPTIRRKRVLSKTSIQRHSGR